MPAFTGSISQPAVGSAGQASWADLVAQFAAAFGAWTTYTPTVTGFTSVTTSTTGEYVQVEKTCFAHVRVQITGVTTLGTAVIGVSLPVAAAASLGGLGIIGSASYRTNAGVYVKGDATGTASSTTMNCRIAAPGGATPNLGNWLGNSPAGQTTNDLWEFVLMYQTV